MRQVVALDQAYKLLNHGPVTLLGSAHHGRCNVMAVAWVMPLDFSPPKVAVVVEGSSFSRELISGSGEFSLSIPGRGIARQVLAAGSCTGIERDKLANLGLDWFPGEVVAAPLVSGCAAWLECRVIPATGMPERFDLFLAEVVAASADDQAFADGRWTFQDENLRTLHYVAGGQFFTTGESLEVSA